MFCLKICFSHISSPNLFTFQYQYLSLLDGWYFQCSTPINVDGIHLDYSKLIREKKSIFVNCASSCNHESPVNLLFHVFFIYFLKLRLWIFVIVQLKYSLLSKWIKQKSLVLMTNPTKTILCKFSWMSEIDF